MKTKSIIIAIATIVFLGLTSFVVKENVQNNTSSGKTVVSNDNDQKIYSNKKIYKFAYGDCGYSITVDIFVTPSGSFYANMKQPEEITGMRIQRMTDSRDYNAFIEYNDCYYAFYLNHEKW